MLEMNETTAHFVEKYVAAGRLPNFARIRLEGATLRTHIPDVDAADARFTRNTSPWIVWSSIYTGMRAADHQLIGFGQDTSHLFGKYLWDVLAHNGRQYGVFGSLISYPPRPEAAFYIPESLASTSDCIPETMRALQRFFLFGAHHYSESSFFRFAAAGLDLLRSAGRAVSWTSALRTCLQVPSELLFGGSAKADRAMLHSILTFDAFERLFRRTRPDFATVHFNHIAYYQHRYWRAVEPHSFRRELSSTDRRFYDDVVERERDEARYAGKIESAYIWTDQVLGRIMDTLSDGDTLLIVSALGQRPYDPVNEIHNPVVRLDRAETFFARLGFEGITVRYEMNPDLTIDCRDEMHAGACEEVVRDLQWNDGSSVFYCQRRRRQLFLELIVPPAVQHDATTSIRCRSRPEFDERAYDYVWQSGTNEQSTAHHDEQGLLMAWRKGGRVGATRTDILVTEIAPAILDLFEIPHQPWHRDHSGPLFPGKHAA